MARYKVTKEQLERVVESFVIESTKRKNTLKESELEEGLFGGKIGKAVDFFISEHAEEVNKIIEAYKKYDESYIELSTNLANKLTFKFLMDLAEQFNIKYSKDKPAMDDNLKTLKSNIMKKIQPMDLPTFKKQMEKGGWKLSDLGGGKGAKA